MEVSSDYEAIESCKTRGLIFITTYLDKDCRLMMLAEDHDSNKNIDTDVDERMFDEYMANRKTHVVATHYKNNLMMMDKNNKPTFNISEAKKFSEKDAKIKARFMNKYGYYEWFAMNVDH
jgi:hypothetical protein